MTTSANRNYPKMTPGNDLAVDVPKLNTTIEMVDQDVQELVGKTANIPPIESPAFTGTPQAPTALPGTSNQQLANTQFVALALANLMGAAPGQLDTLNELAAALGNDPDFAASMTAALADKASLAQLADKFDKSGGSISGVVTMNNTLDFGDSMILTRNIGNGNRGLHLAPNLFMDYDQPNGLWRYYNNGHEAMVIRDDGIVKKSKTPLFAAHCNSPAYQVNSGLIEMSGVMNNNGNHYNGATGRFTAPTDGLYYFDAHIMFGLPNANSVGYVYFQLNGTNTGVVFYTTNAAAGPLGHIMVAAGRPIQLSQGDYVQLFAGLSAGATIYPSAHSGWGGFFIG